MVLPFTQLTHKNQPCVWNSNAVEALESLKHAFMPTLILIHADQAKPFLLEVSASNFTLESSLSQPQVNKQLHPFAFHSEKFEVEKVN